MNRILTAIALSFVASTAFAEGDVAKGEKTFKKCKACHMIADNDGEVIFKGGKTGPNLYGVVGRAAASVEGFKYGKSIVAAGEAGLVWDAEQLANYVKNPKTFLKEVTGDGAAKSKMTFKLKKGGDDVVAYLLSVGPEIVEAEATEAQATEAETTTEETTTESN